MTHLINFKSYLTRLRGLTVTLIVLFSFAIGNARADATFTSSLEAATSAKNGVSLSVTSGSLASGVYYRIDKGATLTISVSSGNITAITFTCTASKYATLYSHSPAGTSYSESGTTVSWEGEAASVTFTANSGKSANNFRFTEVVVTTSGGGSTPTHTLSSAVNPANSGTVALGNTTVEEGSTSTAEATPEDGYIFSSWSITGTGASLSSTSTPKTTVTMGTANATVTANFTAVDCDWFESFDGCSGTGGNDDQWSGSIASTTYADATMADNHTWTLTSGNAAYKCIKLGAGSAQGSATTPTLTGLTGTLTLKFRAAAWNGNSEQTTLNLSTTSGTFSTTSTSSATVTLVKGAWTDYTLTINSVTSAPQITFQGYQASNSRFFIDYVCVKATPTTYTVVNVDIWFYRILSPVNQRITSISQPLHFCRICHSALTDYQQVTNSNFALSSKSA